VVKVDEGAVGPKLSINLLSRQHLSGSLEQQDEDLKRLRVQLDPDPVLAKFTGRDVRLEDSEAIALRCCLIGHV